ncbi:hypothetical protein [Cohnella cellulosilytica]|uniref:Uncharacterized protein n=1 Tax=Cohnella cellulosilytica TaxID=986710 RepID=A0ABW2FR79_9BACL
MDETKEMMLAIKHSVDMLAAKFEGFQAEVRQEFAIVKSEVASLKTDVAELKADVAALKTDVAALKKNVAVLQKGQLRQERIMEKLSLRSVEYETIVSDLQRLHK